MELSLQCKLYDWLEIIDSYTGDSLARLCGRNRQDFIYVASTNIMNIVFKTDGSETFGGFVLEYEGILMAGNVIKLFYLSVDLGVRVMLYE